MSESVKTKLYWAIGIGIAAWVAFFWPHTSTWDGDGQIDAFPSTDVAKNYRLDVSMTVTRQWRGWFRSDGTIEYSNIVGNWPNGGTLEADCTVEGLSRGTCVDQDGKSYGIEVISAPDEPEADSSSD